jgi:rod shape determining protein RodA
MIVLRSIAPFVFPVYFVYLALGIISFLIFSQIDFDVLALFGKYFYIGSIIFLSLPLIIGQVTRGVVRWIPIGPVSIQPAELVRPFLLIFFASYLSQKKVGMGNFLRATLLFSLPFILIVVQPSLGVAIMTSIGFLGVVLASTFNKKILAIFLLGLALFIPLFWHFLAPYQRERIVSFGNYNSIQAMISVGSGQITGQGLGKGTETQLSFLPEKQTDFIFASIAEEMGFVGAILILAVLFFVLFRVSIIITHAESPGARAFVSGVFLSLFAQTFVHVGMNMGMLPITGLPLPLVSAGGSSLIATMTMLGMVIGAKK